MLVSEIPEFGALHHGGQTAIIDGDRRLTYSQLAERSRRLSRGIAAITAPGDRVAILSMNRSEFVEAYYGVPGAGRALVFLNYRLHPRELASIVEDSGAPVVLVEDELRLALEDALRERALSPQLITIGGDGEDYEALLAAGANAPEPPRPEEHELAWVIYTSGTTGRPKGAMLSHRNLIAGLGNWLIDYGPGVRETYLMSFPLCHQAGSGVMGYHLRANTVVLRRSFDPRDVMEQVALHKVSGTSMAPTMMSMVLDHPEFDPRTLASLRTITYGGSPISAVVLKRASEAMPEVGFVQAFGMSELAGSVLCLDKATHARALAGEEHLLLAAGRPMSLSAVRLVDDAMDDVPLGEVGEIVVRGDQVQLGYWRSPEATEESMAGGWFHTGDLARADAEGFVSIVDRKKDMIISGGENIYSREVESVIISHPDVANVAVVGAPDERWGETVCAVVVPRPGSTIDADDIIDHCRASLAGYKRPRRVAIVSELPTNSSGKVLKREIRTRFQ